MRIWRAEYLVSCLTSNASRKARSHLESRQHEQTCDHAPEGEDLQSEPEDADEREELCRRRDPVVFIVHDLAELVFHLVGAPDGSYCRSDVDVHNIKQQSAGHVGEC